MAMQKSDKSTTPLGQGMGSAQGENKKHTPVLSKYINKWKHRI